MGLSERASEPGAATPRAANNNRVLWIYQAFSSAAHTHAQCEGVEMLRPVPWVNRGFRLGRLRLRACLRAYRSDEAGATAIEFAIVALPFLMLLAGIISVGLYYFQVSTIENAAWQAARAIRTGQLQQSSGTYTGLTTDAQRKAAFKTAFCARAAGLPNCSSKSVVIVQSSTAFSGISTPSCTSNGSMISDATAAFSPGQTSAVVLVTVCYAWELGGKLPFMKLGTLSDGSFLMQASVAFRTEPY